MSGKTDESLELFANPEPICPYCKKVATTDTWELRLERDGQLIAIQCDHCRKDLIVEAVVSIDYTTRKMGEAKKGGGE